MILFCGGPMDPNRFFTVLNNTETLDFLSFDDLQDLAKTGSSNMRGIISRHYQNSWYLSFIIPDIEFNYANFTAFETSKRSELFDYILKNTSSAKKLFDNWAIRHLDAFLKWYDTNPEQVDLTFLVALHSCLKTDKKRVITEYIVKHEHREELNLLLQSTQLSLDEYRPIMKIICALYLLVFVQALSFTKEQQGLQKSIMSPSANPKHDEDDYSFGLD